MTGQVASTDTEKDSFDRALEELVTRRNRILHGLINCIPLCYPRLRNWLPGIEKRRYTIVTANQKVGKSKLVDYTFVYEAFFYAIEHPDQLRLKVLYFTLEMGKKEKIYEFLCHLLFRLDGIRISPTNLKSTSADKPVPQEILDLIASDKYQEYVNKFKEMVSYIDTERNPTGIYKYIRNHMLTRGEFQYKMGLKRNEFTGEMEAGKVIDYFQYKDENEYILCVLDNYSNLMQESGMNKMQTIEKMSKYAIELRDTFDLNFIAIQHQAQAQEGIENQKLNKLYPSSDGLADCKTTTRDANLVLGLYSPFKYGLQEHEKYDITKFRNNIRFLYVIEDRDNGSAGQICPLFFDGAVSSFAELPLPEQKEQLRQVMEYIDTVVSRKPSVAMLAFGRQRGIRKVKVSLHRWKKFLTFAGK
jgi:hypothetical protein